MFESKNPREKLDREVLIRLAKEAVGKAYEQNSNALGFVIHGSRAKEVLDEGQKQPKVDSDLDIITIRKNNDREAQNILAGMLWNNIAARYNIRIDTGSWGSLEWEEILQANNSDDYKKSFRERWKQLDDFIVIIGANNEVESKVKNVFL